MRQREGSRWGNALQFSEGYFGYVQSTGVSSA